MAADASAPDTAHASHEDRAIMAPPARIAAVMIPRYPIPISRSGPSVPGRSTTCITASAARAGTTAARVITSVSGHGCTASRSAGIGLLRSSYCAYTQKIHLHLLKRIVDLSGSTDGAGASMACITLRAPAGAPSIITKTDSSLEMFRVGRPGLNDAGVLLV